MTQRIHLSNKTKEAIKEGAEKYGISEDVLVSLALSFFARFH